MNANGHSARAAWLLAGLAVLGWALSSQAEQPALAEVVAGVGRSVVSVVALRRPAPAQQAAEGEARVRRVIGSGFFFSPTDVVTTTDVVAGCDTFYVVTPSGSRHPAALVGGDLLSRIALLRIAEPVGAPVRFARQRDVRPGDDVLVVGNSFGMPGTVSRGIVSAVGRTISTAGLPSVSDAFQVTAEVHPGGAGSPVFDLQGRLVGVVAISAWPLADRAPGGPIEVENLLVSGEVAPPAGSGRAVVYPLTFCLPADTVLFAARQLAERGVVRRGRLGVTVASTPRDVSAYLGLEDFASCTVVAVSAGSPAEKAGLRVHDVIVALDGAQFAGTREFLKHLQQRPGERVTLDVIRQGSRQRVTVTLGVSSAPLKPAPAPARYAVSPGEGSWLGLVAVPASEALAAQANVPAGRALAVLWVQPGGPADRAGLRRGDVIVFGQANAAEQLPAAVSKLSPGAALELEVLRLDGGRKRLRLSIILGQMPDQALPPSLRLAPEALVL